jgi:hypothetical protein
MASHSTRNPKYADMQKAVANIGKYLRQNDREKATQWASTLIRYLTCLGLFTDLSGTGSSDGILPGTLSSPSVPQLSTTARLSKVELTSQQTTVPMPSLTSRDHSRNERGIHA